MNYGLTANPTLNNTECLVIAVFSDNILPDFATSIDKKHNGLLKNLCRRLQEKGDVVCQSDVDGHSLLMISCGDQAGFTAEDLSARITDISNYLLKSRFHSATICMPQLSQHSADWQLQQMLLKIDDNRYQLLDFKSKNQRQHQLEAIEFYLPGADHKTLARAEAIADGVSFTRTLANLPANICTPSYLGKQAVELAQHYEDIHCKILNRNDLEQLGMGALLAVAQGSHEPPLLLEIQYHGSENSPPIILVGKGITFDSGGLTLKPGESMVEMKYDMAGAASVFGTLKACASMRLPINVIGLIACAENMPSGTAVKPGDIVTSMSGQTIEILNTDAEGRLVLADALTYAERFKPRFVIDVATLTGAVIMALGSVASGFMTSDEDLAKMITKAAEESEDKVWRLPLDKQYQEALDSPLADMVNANFDRSAGSVVAACFLSRFTENYRWAHLDVAGTAWVSGKQRNATGRPVPLLIQLLRHVANSR